jgi:subtilisin-like proprotein convertase family protein
MGGVAALLASTLAISNAAEAMMFSSASSTYNIPDNNATGVSATIAIAGEGNITSFDSVTISGFTHSYYGDLRAFLSNGTTTVQLFATDFAPDNATFTGRSSANLSGNYTFATSGADWYAQGTSTTSIVPSANTYASFQSLNAFVGQSLNDTWTLNVQDTANADTGSFTQFSFNATEATPVPFEFEGTGGLMVVGGVWLLRRHLKKKKETKV